MMRFLLRSLGGLAMLVVAVLAGFAALRLAIHGREVAVPSLAGLTDADAAAVTHDLGLNLSVENRFYSAAVAPNHVLSQSPPPGARVRRGLEVRVTESLGSQQVSVPDVIGQTVRPAELVLRRSQLELGTVAHLPAPGPADVILAQTPPPNSLGLNGPRVSLLVAADEPATAAAAYVMPSLVGLTLGAAAARLSSGGLHIASAQEPDLAPTADAATATATAPAMPQDPAIAPTVVSPTLSVGAVIISQSPLPGRKVSRADAIRLVLARRQATPDIAPLLP